MMSVYFKYGVMNGCKSLLLLTTAHNYKSHGYETILLTSGYVCRDKISEMFGNIESRVGLKEKAVMVYDEKDIGEIINLDYIKANKGKIVMFIDEVSFMSVEFVESLFRLAIETGITILCYGLLTDFKTKMFPASKRLIELGAKLERLKSVDENGEVPVINSLWIDGKIQTEGDSVQMGREEKYRTMSLRQYWKAIGEY